MVFVQALRVAAVLVVAAADGHDVGHSSRPLVRRAGGSESPVAVDIVRHAPATRSPDGGQPGPGHAQGTLMDLRDLAVEELENLDSMDAHDLAVNESEDSDVLDAHGALSEVEPTKYCRGGVSTLSGRLAVWRLVDSRTQKIIHTSRWRCDDMNGSFLIHRRDKRSIEECSKMCYGKNNYCADSEYTFSVGPENEPMYGESPDPNGNFRCRCCSCGNRDWQHHLGIQKDNWRAFICQPPPCVDASRVEGTCHCGDGNICGTGQWCKEDCGICVSPPTPAPTRHPTPVPTVNPTRQPTPPPTEHPTPVPTADPTRRPTEPPTPDPTQMPSPDPPCVRNRKKTQYPTPMPSLY